MICVISGLIYRQNSPLGQGQTACTAQSMLCDATSNLSITATQDLQSYIEFTSFCSPSENDKCLKKGEVSENNSEIHQKPQNFIPCKSICILYVTFYVSWNVRLFAKYFNSFLVCPKCANRFLVISNGVRYCVIN